MSADDLVTPQGRMLVALFPESVRAAYQWEQALAHATQLLASTLLDPRFDAFLAYVEELRRHHPPALCIDGHAYRRRTRRRNRRNR